MSRRVVVLVGGVGGAKVALGLQAVVPAEDLTIVVNVADDMWHYGLRICPDLDTVLYTLAGRVDPVNGWGVQGDTIAMLEALRGLGEDAWFRLGDADLAVHLLRTHLLATGHTLTQIVDRIRTAWGIGPQILPVTDDEIATLVTTSEHGELAFQDYFVRHRWQPTVTHLRYAGADTARLNPRVVTAIQQADVLMIAPSNPWLSIAPLFAVPGLREQWLARSVPRVAITPIISGQAVKGPAAKLMAELGYEVSVQAVVDYYGDLINGFVADERDARPASSHARVTSFDTMMTTLDHKIGLVQGVLDWTNEWEQV